MILARYALAIFAVFFSLSLLNAEDGKPNTLTAKEIEEGWIMLFDGETTFGWKVEGEASVKDGILKLGGTKSASLTSTTAWDLCELKVEFAGTKTLSFAFHHRPDKVIECHGLDKWCSMKYAFPRKTSIDFDISCVGQEAAIVGAIATPERKPFAMAPLRFDVNETETILFKSIKLRPMGSKPLFNGKALTGWKSFPGDKYKSVFSVTSEGWLNVKNGPGDLQTEGKFDDFVLQLECISNGKWLNSGIFFRCLENEYQQGYEMQIQNGFLGDDRAKPLDFGTGAIYRRSPARKVVANDKEWFGMTLAAQGNHFATWVNGYQTVDWTDDRKEDNNARKGSKTGAGHLSIQGHDPTTDLSFRNLRIGELKEAKK